MWKRVTPNALSYQYRTCPAFLPLIIGPVPLFPLQTPYFVNIGPVPLFFSFVNIGPVPLFFSPSCHYRTCPAFFP